MRSARAGVAGLWTISPRSGRSSTAKAENSNSDSPSSRWWRRFRPSPWATTSLLRHSASNSGLITPLVEVARDKRMSAFVGEGENRWAAAHVLDVARPYRLGPGGGARRARYDAVAEEGVTAREMAEVIGAGLGVPAVGPSPAEAAAHFGRLGMFVGLDMPASSAWTRGRLGWRPQGPSLIADLKRMDYGAAAAA